MGKLYGIGVGPGDPELLTLKAYKILQQADVIFCPEKKKGAGSFAFDIIKEHVKDSKTQIVDLEYPMHYHGDELKKMWKPQALSGGRQQAGLLRCIVRVLQAKTAICP